MTKLCQEKKYVKSNQQITIAVVQIPTKGSATIPYMIRKMAWVSVIAAVAFFGTAAWTLYQSTQTPQIVSTTPQANDEEIGDGRYVAYQPEAFDDKRYVTTILFFTRPGSEESDTFDGALSHSTIPSGVQIVRVDVSTQTELTQKYDITIPPTFVRVAEDGTAQKTWQAYGQTKTLEAVLAHTE